MTDSFQVKGAEKFLRLSKSLKIAGDLEMRRELNRALREVTKPLIAETRAAAEERLPKRGGLNRSVAKAKPWPNCPTFPPPAEKRSARQARMTLLSWRPAWRFPVAGRGLW